MFEDLGGVLERSRRSMIVLPNASRCEGCGWFDMVYPGVRETVQLAGPSGQRRLLTAGKCWCGVLAEAIAEVDGSKEGEAMAMEPRKRVEQLLEEAGRELEDAKHAYWHGDPAADADKVTKPLLDATEKLTAAVQNLAAAVAVLQSDVRRTAEEA